MALNMNTVVEQIKGQIDAKAATATPAELAYLTQAVGNIAGQATLLDMLQKSEEYQQLLTATGDAQKTEIQALMQTVARNGLANMELVDSKLVRFTSDANLTASSESYRALLDAGGDMFGVLAHCTGSGRCGLYVTPVAVDANGLLSVSAGLTVWYNPSYSGISTTSVVHYPGTGKFICPGHNIYPGRSSHGYGYGWGFLKADGTMSVGYQVDGKGARNNYHQTGVESGSGFAASWAGYNGNAPYRMRCDFSGDTPSVNYEVTNANSSTAYDVQMIGQDGVASVLDGLVYFYISSQYRVRAGSGANFSDRTVSQQKSNDIAFTLSTGSVVHYIDGAPARLYTSHSESSDIEEVFPLQMSTWSGAQYTSVGQDRWLVVHPYTFRILLLDIDPTTCRVTIADQADFIGLAALVGTSTRVYIRPTVDAKHLIFMVPTGSNGMYAQVQTYKNPLDFTIGQGE